MEVRVIVDALSQFFVQQPLHILAVAVVHFLLWAVARFGKIAPVRHPNAILTPASAWLAYAAWEWLVLIETPEANIRIDLLLIWPLLVIVMTWAVVRAFWA